jgi:uncharacterized iron-regulated membrane protein
MRTDSRKPTHPRAIRPILGALHRWVGLVIAGVLFFSGLTGAVISWDHELDELLNPRLLYARAIGTPLSSLALARQVEANHPNVEVTSFPLAVEQGHSLAFWVEPKIDPKTKRLRDVDYNQVFVHPVTGAELGKRQWGAAWPLTRENFVSFLYKLHYSLHLPEMLGTDRWGIWLLGGIALVWTLDCFVGLYLTLPARRRVRENADDALAQGEGAPTAAPGRSFWRRWRPSWNVRWRGGSYRLSFDLHRAAGLWAWSFLFMLAFTGFSLNLYREVFFPVMSLVSSVTPSPFDRRTPKDHHEPIAAGVTFEAVVPLAIAEASRRGWQSPAGELFYTRDYGIYGVQFFHPEDEHGAAGVGHQTLYYDAVDGRLLGERQPWKGTAADIFVQAQFPVHSGRILGLPGRVLISVMGLVVAGLSVTGVLVWWRKHRARLYAARRGPSDKAAQTSASTATV